MFSRNSKCLVTLFNSLCWLFSFNSRNLSITSNHPSLRCIFHKTLTLHTAIGRGNKEWQGKDQKNNYFISTVNLVGSFWVKISIAWGQEGSVKKKNIAHPLIPWLDSNWDYLSGGLLSTVSHLTQRKYWTELLPYGASRSPKHVLSSHPYSCDLVRLRKRTLASPLLETHSTLSLKEVDSVLTAVVRTDWFVGLF